MPYDEHIMARIRWGRLAGIAFSLCLVLLPQVTFAASNSFFSGPIFPKECHCDSVTGEDGKSYASAPDFGCVLQVFQNVLRFVIYIGILMCVVWIAYGGFSLMTNGGNPEALSQARTRVTNALVGIAVILCSWLIVDFVMKFLYEPSAVFGGKTLGPWNSIIHADDPDLCIKPTMPRSITNEVLNGATNAPKPTAPSDTSGTSTPGTLSSSGQGSCNPTNVSNAAKDAGITMDPKEATILACFAGPESRCGAQNENYNWNAKQKPPPSTAYGPYQITLKGNSACFDNPACSKAAGVSGNLNCKQAFDQKGYVIPGAALNRCKTAAADLTCSTAAAHCMYQQYGVRPWTNNSDSTAAHQACAAKNGN
jgi:hypothetical protein